MHRLNVCRVGIACFGALALLLAGCAAPGTGTDAGTTTETAYPDWVRLVPEATAEASYYIGAISLARDVESGIEAAEADALSQALEGQRRYFIQLFDRAAGESGVETTSHERLEFRSGIADEVSGRLGAATHREGVHYRHCEGDAGVLCEMYILLRLDHQERDQIFEEALAALGEQKQREGKADIALLIEWMLRNQ